MLSTLNPPPGVINPRFRPFAAAGSAEPKKSDGKLLLFVKAAGTASQFTSLRPFVAPGAQFNWSPANCLNSFNFAITPALSPEADITTAFIVGFGTGVPHNHHYFCCNLLSIMPLQPQPLRVVH
ncbi:MAG: hypothetical protein ABI707_06850 [Ferruginibacter sp.]